jgi:hypothetical protein|nr:MAG TPA: Cell cycle protein [Caudoviricetes sp.]
MTDVKVYSVDEVNHLISEMDKVIAELKTENAALRERLEKSVELPVKVGDLVYLAGAPQNSSRIEAEIEVIRFTNGHITYEWVQYDGSSELTECWDEGYFEIEDIGKTVFLTHEAAEARLAELKGEER